MLPLLIIFAVTYILIATEWVDKSIAAILGASAVVIFQYIEYDDALRHIDLNVIFLLMGMMMMVNVLSKTGIFEWVAITIAQKAKGSGTVILMLFLVVTAVFSAFLDNVTTIILIAPLTILIAQLLDLPAVPFLILEALFSNIGGTATLIGDPPNILIGSRAGLSFNQFLIHLGPAVLVILIISLAVSHWMMRKHAKTKVAARQRIMNAIPHLAITDPRRLWVALAVFAFVLLGFFLGRLANLEPGIVALGGGFLMTLLCRGDVHKTLEHIEWSTILFFIGLFMLVGALEVNGVFVWLGERITTLTQGNLLLAAITILWVSAFTSAIVDNVPLVIAMLPIIESITPIFAEQLGVNHDPNLTRVLVEEPLAWSLALGACLGGNGTLVGASANVVVSQIARKNKYPVTFMAFTRIGFPMMLVSLVIATVYVYLRYFCFV